MFKKLNHFNKNFWLLKYGNLVSPQKLETIFYKRLVLRHQIYRKLSINKNYNNFLFDDFKKGQIKFLLLCHLNNFSHSNLSLIRLFGKHYYYQTQ